tara:strand:- start:2233 stop:3231 length:999 start_codon:yes stop_codon:yes gene_type:complete
LNIYQNKYHTQNLNKLSFLITGGAGFIGSNIVEYLIKHNAGYVRVLDNLSNGSITNIEKFKKLENFEFIEGDINDYDTCLKAVNEINFVSHQAALGSVPRSISNPIKTNEANITGFLNIIDCARKSKSLLRFVYAASSSSYGDSKTLPKVEGYEGKPLSPYAVTKFVNELYAEVYSKVYNFNSIGLRYFNVFGPNQSFNNPYAAVIPIFCNAFINGHKPTIFGDGETSRDFTFVENAVQANIRSFFVEKLDKHEVFNVACGDQISLNNLVEELQLISKKNIKPIYSNERIGDIKHSKASIKKIQNKLGFNPNFNFKTGLNQVYKWYESNKLF